MEVSVVKNIIILSVLLLFETTLYSQNIPADTLTNKELRKQKHKKRIEDGKILFTPIFFPGYTPELQGLFAIGGLVSFKAIKDSDCQRSSFPFTLAYTTTGAIVSTSKLTSYWFHDKLRVNIDINYKDMPDHYWGIGYQSAYNNYKSDSTTLYNRKWWAVNPKFLYQHKRGYLLGVDLDYNYTKGSNEATLVTKDSIYIIYNNKPFNSGLGFIFRYDTRDVATDPHSGYYFNFNTTFYSPVLGGNNKFTKEELDFRHYKQFSDKPQLLALQMKVRLTQGDVPYGEMSQLGTPFDLRGYLWGRYRNNNLFFAILEYRHKFMKRSGIESKHGFVTWVGSGKVFNLKSDGSDNNGWLPNAGIGYRLEVQPRMFVRLDMGFGKKSNGFYVQFNQAF